MGVSGAKLLLLWGGTLLLIMSCQMTGFPDVPVASLRNFPCNRKCFNFFRGFQWMILSPGFCEGHTVELPCEDVERVLDCLLDKPSS